MSANNLDSKSLPGLRYVGFWPRLLALLIDAALAGVIVMPIVYFGSRASRFFDLYWIVPGILFTLWFHVYLVMKFGGTPGKLLIKIRIAMLDGSHVTPKAAMLRYIVLFSLSLVATIASIILHSQMTDAQYFSLIRLENAEELANFMPTWYKAIPMLMQIWMWGELVTMLFNKKRRSIDDFIAGTIVIKKDSPNHP